MNAIETKQMQNIITHFSKRAENYDQNFDWVNDGNILDIIVGNLPKSYGTILDLGAGTGAVSKYILKRFGAGYEITAIDICQDMLDKIKDHRVKTICSGVEELPFQNNSYNVVVSRQCLHYVENVERALDEVNRVLKPNGIFILAQIVPFDKETSSDWESIIKIRQPLRKWYFTSDEWNMIAERHSLFLQFEQKYIRDASVGKWAGKYSSDNNMILKYKQKLLSMDNEFKRKYAIVENNYDVIYQSFWHIARYSKK